MLHRLQLRAQVALLGQDGSNRLVRWLVPKVLPVVLRSPFMPRLQRRLFFGAPLCPLDPAFSFREPSATVPVDPRSRGAVERREVPELRA
jgi:hypothetical protein